MASSAVQDDSDDGMDEFMDKFKTERYRNAFSEDNWEEVPLTRRNYELPPSQSPLNLTDQC